MAGKPQDDGRMSAVKAVHPRISYADLERLPEDGRRYELYDGEVFVVPAPLLRHQIAQLRLVEMLDAYAKERGGIAAPSPIDIVFSDYDVLQPDVIYFRPERAHLVDLDRVIRHPPDLCVEVLSPSTEATDRGKKMQMFARYGVSEYWIVNPHEASIEVYELEQGGYVLRLTASGENAVMSRSLPGFSFTAKSVFP
jgi:Uma2 family endonuclease